MKTPPPPTFSSDVNMARDKLASLQHRVKQGDITQKELVAAVTTICHYMKVPT